MAAREVSRSRDQVKSAIFFRIEVSSMGLN